MLRGRGVSICQSMSNSRTSLWSFSIHSKFRTVLPGPLWCLIIRLLTICEKFSLANFYRLILPLARARVRDEARCQGKYLMSYSEKSMTSRWLWCYDVIAFWKKILTRLPCPVRATIFFEWIATLQWKEMSPSCGNSINIITNRVDSRAQTLLAPR